MNKILTTLSAVALSGCVATTPPTITARCDLAPEQSALHLQALRTKMTVLSLACHEDERYNAFIRQFKPTLQANEIAMNAYFRTRGGQVAHDRFVTEMANEMSHRAIAQGATFCAHDSALFTEVAATPPSGLERLAADKALVPPSLATCKARSL